MGTLTRPRVGLQLARTLLTPDARSAHILAFGSVFGIHLWTTFIGGIVQHKTLPRQQFGLLQSKQFPIYFSLSMGLSASMLLTYLLENPTVRRNPFDIWDGAVYQAWTLGTVALSHAANYFFVGPTSTRVMFERHRLERSEGKSYTEEGISDDMKALNTRFGFLHGISSSLNLIAFGGLVAHGLWIAKFGL